MGEIRAPESNWLWARSRGQCARPGCGKRLVKVDGSKRITVGERAHIRSGRPNGPRYDADYRDVDRYENLILLCLEHHTLIDAQADPYPVELLERWKADHEGSAGPAAGAWLAPPPSSTRYLRRDAEYGEVSVLEKDKPVIVIAGLSGAGKSQLAIDYFTSMSDEFTIRAWLRASDEDTLAEDYATLGVLLNVFPVPNVDTGPSFAAKVRAALEVSPGWLIVFDDAPDASAVHHYLPRAGGISLVTTKARAWPDLPTVHMGPLPRSASIDLLATNAQFAADARSSNRAAEVVGDLPLALTQVLGFMAATGVPVTEVIDLLVENTAELMARGEPPDHPALRSVIEQSTAALSPDGRSLLQMLAVLAGVPLPVPRPSVVAPPAGAGFPGWMGVRLPWRMR